VMLNSSPVRNFVVVVDVFVVRNIMTATQNDTE
jgi:hypothetical protein